MNRLLPDIMSKSVPNNPAGGTPGGQSQTQVMIKKINGTEFANTNSVRNLHQVSSANPRTHLYVPTQTSLEKHISEEPVVKPRGRVGLAPV